MKKSFILGAVLSAVLFFTACDDDSSSTSANNEPSEEATLSSSDKVESSSSEKTVSSSSEKKASGDEKSSSSEKAAEPKSSSDKASGDDVKSSSSEEVKNDKESSSSEKIAKESSSSVEDAVSSSSEAESSSNDIPMSIAEAKVMPSGTYDCKKYNCVTTEYLNQELLEAGKYGEILDERDNHVYKTIEIDGWVWMAQNLDYADSVRTPSLLERNACFKYEPDSCSKYGRLYTWAAAIDSVAWATDKDNPRRCGYDRKKTDGTCDFLGVVQGICPKGWHLPNYGEWMSMVNFVTEGYHHVPDYSQGYEMSIALRSLTEWPSRTHGGDPFGFSVLPSGYGEFRNYYGELQSHFFTFKSYFWTAWEDDGEYAKAVFFDDEETSYITESRYPSAIKYLVFSIRCRKDDE